MVALAALLSDSSDLCMSLALYICIYVCIFLYILYIAQNLGSRKLRKTGTQNMLGRENIGGFCIYSKEIKILVDKTLEN